MDPIPVFRDNYVEIISTSMPSNAKISHPYFTTSLPDTELNNAILQHLAENNDDIAAILERINDNLSINLSKLSVSITDTIHNASGISLGTALLSIFIVIIGAFSAYLFNHLHWRNVKKNDKINSGTGNLVTLLEKLELIAIEYWLKEYSEESNIEIESSEIQIKSILKLIVKQTNLTLNLAKNGTLDINHPLMRQVEELFDLITGGDFESHGRERSKIKATKISNLCTETQILLQEFSLDL